MTGTLYDQAVLALPGLSSYWKLDDYSATVVDSGPAGVNGTVVGAVGQRAAPLIDGSQSQASMQFGTAGAYLEFGDVDDFAGGAFSVCCWFSPDAATASNRAIIDKAASGTDGWRIRQASTNVLQALRVKTGQTSITSGRSDRPVTAASVYFLVWAFDGTTQSLWIFQDGQLWVTDTDTATFALPDTAAALRVGAFSNSTTSASVFQGRISNVALTTSALTLADAQALVAAAQIRDAGVRRPVWPRVQIVLAGRDITALCDDVTFSSVDPGGHETCTMTVAPAVKAAKGDRLQVRCATQVAWDGRVEEPGHVGRGRAASQISAVGAGAALKDDQMVCVYVDRDLTGWKGPSRDRRLDLISYRIFDPRADTDITNGEPCLTTELTDTWTKGLSEAWYDAGQNTRLGGIFVEWANQSGNISVADTNWDWDVFAVDDDGSGAETRLGGNLRAAGTTDQRYFSLPSTRFVMVSLAYAVAGGADGTTYPINWRKVAVFGNHDIPRRGPDPGGLYPDDIARHALRQTDGIVPGVIEQCTGLIVPHAVYKDPVDPEKPIDDMATLAGWHWGVWEPLTLMDDLPRLDFRARPADPTCTVQRADTEDLDLVEKLTDVYDQARVTYQDAAGTTFTELVTIPTPDLPEGQHRTLPLSLGTGTQASAQAFGRFALLLAQSANRAGGSCTLPLTVTTTSGGAKPAMLVKAGLDRLRIRDLPNMAPLADDQQRRDAFRVRRVETSIQRGQAPRTRVELDGGADLIEVLQARLQVATGVAAGG